MQSFQPPRWYCARTKPKHEQLAAESLRRHLQLEVFHPRLRMERAGRRGVMRVIEPLFPCYLFFCAIAEQLDEVRFTPGIHSVVQFGMRIPVVPDAVIDELRLCFETEEPMPLEERLYPGAEVSVAGGAFLGFRGIVVQASSSKQRVQILLDFLGRATLAEVDRACLTLENQTMADMMPSLALAPRSAAAA